MNLRERCEKAWFDAHEQYLRHGNIPVIVDVVEAFAREIRNEAIDKCRDIHEQCGAGSGCCDNLMVALKTDALIARVNENEQD